MNTDRPFIQQAIALLGEVIPDVVLHLDADHRLAQIHGEHMLSSDLFESFIGLHIDACEALIPWVDKDLIAQLRGAVYRTLYERERAQASFTLRWPSELSAARYYNLHALPLLDDTILLIRDTTAERTLEKQLAISERMASLGTLAAGVAHEINNPLTYVQCNITLALEEIEHALVCEAHGSVERARLDDVKESLRVALDGTQRVSRITQELKHFSRVQHHKLSSLSIEDVLDSAIKLADNTIRHRATLHVRHSVERDKLPLVFGDPHQLTQVFINVLVNAAQAFDAHHTSDPAIVVEISTAHQGLDDLVIVSIKDNGEGMSEETLRRIFDPFFTTKTDSGTGLGLSVSHRIVQDLGGSMEARSKRYHGTTITISLPASQCVVAAHSASDLTIESDKATDAMILVIEDEPPIQDLIARILDHHHVHIVTSIREAIAYLAHHTPDVILCDLMLPGQGGEALHAHLLAQRPELLQGTLFMTGGAFTPSSEEFLQLEQPHLLIKPFGSKTLLEWIDRLIHHRGDS